MFLVCFMPARAAPGLWVWWSPTQTSSFPHLLVQQTADDPLYCIGPCIGLEGAVETEQGTKAGDLLGDIVSGFLMAKY